MSMKMLSCRRIDRGEKVLGGGEENALFHEAGAYSHALLVALALRWESYRGPRGGKTMPVSAGAGQAEVAVDTSMESTPSATARGRW